MRKEYSNFFIHAIVITSLLLLYTLSSIFLLPGKGINILFISQFWKLLLLALLVLISALSCFLYFKKDKTLEYKKIFEKAELGDFCIALIPLSPIVQYIFHNQDILNFHKSLIVFAFFALIAIVICVIIPLILSVFISKRNLQIASSAFLYAIFNMASLAATNQWHQQGVFLIQALTFVAVLAILLIISTIAKQKFNAIVFIFFIANLVTAFISTAPSQKTTDNFSEKIAKLPIYSEVINKDIANKRNIIFLSYESYTNNETLKGYGFDNSEQVNFLNNNGFHIYNNAYSTGPCTHSSMGNVFSVGKDMHPEYGSIMYERSRKHIVGGAVQTLLQSKGYKSLGVFKTDSFFRGIMLNEIKYDYYFPPLTGDESSLLISSILEGEFRHEAGYEKIDHQLYTAGKLQALAQKQLSPYIFYSHSTLPGHSQNTGRCMDNDTPKYFEGLRKANIEMRADIETAIQNNPKAIIIVSGDHGPYLTKNCAFLARMGDAITTNDVNRLDIQDRHGVLLAIRWPEKEYATKHNIVTLQDIFPAIFSYMFNDNGIFNKTRTERVTLYSDRVLKGVKVIDGVIKGGKDNNLPLFPDQS